MPGSSAAASADYFPPRISVVAPAVLAEAPAVGAPVEAPSLAFPLPAEMPAPPPPVPIPAPSPTKEETRARVELETQEVKPPPRIEPVAVPNEPAVPPAETATAAPTENPPVWQR